MEVYFFYLGILHVLTRGFVNYTRTEVCGMLMMFYGHKYMNNISRTALNLMILLWFYLTKTILFN